MTATSDKGNAVATNSDFGSAGRVFGTDLARALRVAERIEPPSLKGALV